MTADAETAWTIDENPSMPLALARRSFTAHVPAGDARLHADVAIPERAIGMVLFANPSALAGDGTRSRYVASQLNTVRIATAIVDLLTPDEELLDTRNGSWSCNVGFLADRVVRLIDWTSTLEEHASLPVGLFGAGVGVAALLDAAAARPDTVAAVVARGGRPDMAKDIDGVSAATLLIVGSEDAVALDANSATLARLACRRRLEIVPGAGHSFDEPGALERVAGLASAWYHEHL